jgi:hypothetical protein
MISAGHGLLKNSVHGPAGASAVRGSVLKGLRRPAAPYGPQRMTGFGR